MTTGEEDSLALSTRLESKALHTIGELIPEYTPVAVVDFPYSDNFGDSAIWLGQNALLKRRSHVRKYVADVGRYKPEDLLRSHPNGPILLHGGGNFGDYWPEHQQFREQVMADFPDRAIVQLPQSVGFQDPAARESVARRMRSHPNFTLLVRDQASLQLGLEMGLRSILCPDSATHLGPLHRIGEPSIDILVLARSDHESSGLRAYAEAFAPSGATVEEWGFTKFDRALWTASKSGPRLCRRLPTASGARPAFQPPLRASYDLMARLSLRAAIRQLSRARVIVTDRLHAHVIATLLDIPNIVLDNSYGKVSGIYQAFTHTSSTAERASDPEGAFARASQIVRS